MSFGFLPTVCLTVGIHNGDLCIFFFFFLFCFNSIVRGIFYGNSSKCSVKCSSRCDAAMSCDAVCYVVSVCFSVSDDIPFLLQLWTLK